MAFYTLTQCKNFKEEKVKFLNFLSDNKIPFPKTFVITYDSLLDLFSSNGFINEYNQLISSLKFQKDQRILDKIFSVIKNLNPNENFLDNLNKLYSATCYNGQTPTSYELQNKCFLVVRASDADKNIDTFTNIKNKEELFKAIKSCWASYFKIDTFDINNSMNLILQKMVKSEKSGNVNVYPDSININAFWGQTGFINKVAVEFWSYSPNSNSVIEHNKQIQDFAFGIDDNGVFVKKLIPPELQSKPVLNEKELKQIVDLSKYLLKNFGKSNFEFGFEKGRVTVITLKKIIEEKKLEGDSLLDFYDDENLNQPSEVESNPQVNEMAPEIKETTESEIINIDPIMSDSTINSGSELPKDKIEEIIYKYITINPYLKETLLLLFEDLKKELN
jgi:phosphoenolpyruvate synthase/pyruvate phosphate dikinase